MIIRRRVVVSGRVQGVWFRDSCRHEAMALGVGGWVRNCYDGNVEGEFEGDEQAVARLIEWCRQGPARAVVTAVEVSELAPTGSAQHFAVR